MLGDLGPIFARRRIAAGVDRNGNLVLVRPDKIQVDYSDKGRREQIDRIVATIGADNSDETERDLALRSGVWTVNVPAVLDESGPEPRWPVEPLDGYLGLFEDVDIRAIPCHVFIGSQSHVPRFLGASAAWVGEMAFPGETTDKTPSGMMVKLTTAEPAAEPTFLREPLNIAKRRRPRILVLDTGLRTEGGAGARIENAALRRSAQNRTLNIHLHTPWLDDPTVGAQDDEDEPDDDGSGTLDFEAGHGTFVTGIVRQVCPDAEVHPAGVLSSFGEGDPATVLRTIARMIAPGDPPFDIVIMSFGAHFTDDDATLFGDALKALLGDALMVAAAGNQQTCRPYFPAGLHDVIGVGGLEAGGKAWFTNFGPWVDASAPAIDVVSTFFNDFPEVIDGKPTRHFKQWARWSGTSFSAPKVAAAVAQEMYLYGGTAHEAWKRLSTFRHHRFPDLGVVFNL